MNDTQKSKAQLLEEIKKLQSQVLELKQSEQNFILFMDHLPGCAFIKDEKGKYIFLNKHYKTVYGFDIQNLLGKGDEELWDKEIVQIFRENDNKIRNGKESLEFEDKVLIKNKEYTWHTYKYSMPKGFVAGMSFDISKQKQAEEALKESEEKFKTVANFNHDWEYWIGPDSNYIYVSPAVKHITGYSPQEFYDNKEILKKIIHPDDLSLVIGHHHKIVNGETEPIDFRIVTKKGEIRWIGHVCNEVINETGKLLGRRGGNRDITDRVLAENERTSLREQLLETRNMEAIAQLAGGVAHDFNNALTTVLGNIELLNMYLPNNKIVQKFTFPIKESTAQMSHLTNQLLAYARGGKYQPKTILLDEFIKESIPLIKHSISPAIKILLETGSSTNPIEADTTQLQMILSSIITNSAEAIENKGIIEISSFQCEIDKQFIKTHPDRKAGTYICLSIKDNGSGMDKETLERIFEPFFTTKFQGRGLGMASVYGIMKNHNGYIEVLSEPGSGTKIQLIFPLSKKIINKKPAEVPVILRGNATILLVEDEEFVMEIGLEVLEHLGYRTLSAKNGTEALHIVNTFNGAIDLILLDMGLPDIPGGVLYFKLIEARPDLKVIICSGYTVEGPVQKVLDAGALDFIQKPYSISLISQVLSKHLNNK